MVNGAAGDETLEELLAPPEPMTSETVVMSDESLVNALLMNPSLVETVVRLYVDTDADGFVSVSELKLLLQD